MGKLKTSVLKQRNESDDIGKDPMTGDEKNAPKGKGKKYSPAAIKAACK